MLKDLYTQMLKYNFKPNHRLDQNYMIDDSIIDLVVTELKLKQTEIILEIGGGTGFLTKKLITQPKVIVIEKDKKMCDILKEEINSKNLEIINKDVLDVNIKEITCDKIVGFIPYSISKEIIEKIIITNKKTVLVVQKEFAEKLTAIPGFKNYTTVSVLAQNYFNLKIIKKISKKSFFPVPNCESAIISFEPINKEYDLNFVNFIRELFRYSNKDLYNALRLISNNIEDKKYLEKIKNIKEDLLKRKVKALDSNNLNEIHKKLFK